MTRFKISLVTLSDIRTFVEAVSVLKGTTVLENENGDYRVNARSFLGAIAAVGDWNDIWVASEDDKLYSVISKFVI